MRERREELERDIDLYEHMKGMIFDRVKSIYESGMHNDPDDVFGSYMEGLAEGMMYCVRKLEYQIDWRKKRLLEGYEKESECVWVRGEEDGR